VGCKLAECHDHTGKAAALAAADKQRQFRMHGEAEQYTFVLCAVESHGQLCKEAVDILHMSAEWGAGTGLQRAGKGAWLMSFYREITSALFRGNSFMYAKSAEHSFALRGATSSRVMRCPPLRAGRCRLFLSFSAASCGL
jgi:hypothetical protein